MPSQQQQQQLQHQQQQHQQQQPQPLQQQQPQPLQQQQQQQQQVIQNFINNENQMNYLPDNISYSAPVSTLMNTNNIMLKDMSQLINQNASLLPNNNNNNSNNNNSSPNQSHNVELSLYDDPKCKKFYSDLDQELVFQQQQQQQPHHSHQRCVIAYFFKFNHYRIFLFYPITLPIKSIG